jgi:hypothetical protein
MVAFIGRQSENQNTTTNQKQAATTEGSMEGIFDKWDARGSAMPSFGGVVSWIGGKNIK